MSLPRMRTAQGALSEIKAQDPATQVTLHYIRHIIAANKIPVVPVGRKKLVNVEELLKFLASGQPVEASKTIGQIRRVRL